MKHIFYILLFPLAFILTSCPDEDPVKPDPCEGKMPVSAEFHIYEQPYIIHDDWELYDTDTSFTVDNMFVAVGQADEYEWHIGSEILFGKNVFRRNFPRGVNIPIKLIARGVPDTACFPFDDGKDTVVRYLYLARVEGEDEPCNFEFDLFSGDFWGYNSDSPTDTFTITIDACYPYHLGDKITRLINLPKGCDIIFKPSPFNLGSYKQWRFVAEPGNYDCLTPRGIARIYGKNNDSLTIKYQIQQAPGYEYFYKERIKKEFIGVRVK